MGLGGYEVCTFSVVRRVWEAKVRKAVFPGGSSVGLAMPWVEAPGEVNDGSRFRCSLSRRRFRTHDKHDTETSRPDLRHGEQDSSQC